MCKCRCCKKEAKDISEYIYSSIDSNIPADEYVRNFEGTYDEVTDSFLCTDCYLKRRLS